MKDMSISDVLQAEQRTVSQTGEVFIEGRNWFAPELVEHINKRVYLLLDVVGGELVVHVYSLVGQHICQAKLVEKTQWNPVAYRAQIVTTKGPTQ